MKPCSIHTFPVLAVVALFSAAACAGDIDLKVEAGASITAEADFSDSGGKLEVQELDVSAATDAVLDDKQTVGGSAGVKVYTFDFGEALLVEDQTDPFETIAVVDLQGRYAYRTDSAWEILSGAGLRIAAESGAESDAVTVGVLAGGKYPLADNLQLGLAVVARTRIEDSVAVVLFPVIEWDLSDDLTLTTQYDYTRQGATLAYALDEANTISLGAHYETVRFRTKGVDEATKDRVGQYDSLPVSLGWQHSFGPYAFIALNLDVVTWHEISLDEDDGDELGEDELDATFGAGISGGLIF
jgi:hypothetical protein